MLAIVQAVTDVTRSVTRQDLAVLDKEIVTRIAIANLASGVEVTTVTMMLCLILMRTAAIE